MTYIVNDACIACKYTDCVEVCPVDCFYEGENMLVIHPDECIDCGVCEPECPADAIRPDTEPEAEKWVEFNRKYSELWPVIISQKEPLADAEAASRLADAEVASRPDVRLPLREGLFSWGGAGSAGPVVSDVRNAIRLEEDETPDSPRTGTGFVRPSDMEPG